MGINFGSFAGGLAGGMAAGMRMRDWMDERQLKDELRTAGSITPETIENAGDYTKTMGLEGATEQARMLQEQDAAFGADGARSTADALNSNASDTTPAMTDGGVKTSYRLAGKEQETPFTSEQVDAARYRGQADVLTRNGKTERAAGLYGLAKQREEEGVNSQIRASANAGLAPNMRDQEKAFTISKNMYEQAIKLNRPDLAQGYYTQMKQNRAELLDDSWNRAERVRRSTGSLSGYIDTFNKFVADGQYIENVPQEVDGKYTINVRDDLTGQTRSIDVPKEKIGDYLLQMKDIKRVEEIEQRRAEILFKAQADAQEALNKPITVGKDQTVVIPSTGQTYSPGGNRGFDPKDAGPVLDDARKILLERSGNFDQASGKWNWTPETQTKAVLAERLYAKNPSMGPAQLAEIADNGKTGIATIEVNGQKQQVPAIVHNGKTYMLDGNSGVQPSAAPAAAAPKAATGTTGLGTRDVRGKISQPPTAPTAGAGLESAPPRKSSTPADFPRVSSSEQAQRDAEAKQLILKEFAQDMPPASRRALEEEFKRRFKAMPPTQQEAIAAMA